MMEVVREIMREEIAAGLRELGLCAGDRVMVHSSLKSFGRVQGGAETVVFALQDVLTEQGTLMMPSFNHTSLKGGTYDPRETRTRNGAIPDTFWRMPEVHRSLDPSHPIACWGKDAQRYIRFHHRTLTLGPDSPLGLLGREGGKGLMLGVGYGPNTFHHVVETALNVPCLGHRTEAYPLRLPDGRVVMGRTWGWRAEACPFTDRVRYAPLMQPYERRKKIGQCEAILFSFADARTVIESALREPCRGCLIRPRVNRFVVESDWDEAKGCLKADSVAWSY